MQKREIPENTTHHTRQRSLEASKDHPSLICPVEEKNNGLSIALSSWLRPLIKWDLMEKKIYTCTGAPQHETQKATRGLRLMCWYYPELTERKGVWDFKVVVVVKSLSCTGLFVTPWPVACQAALSMGFPRQVYWSGCHFLLQGIFWLRDRTHLFCVSCIGGLILYYWATKEAQEFKKRKAIYMKVREVWKAKVILPGR